MKFALITEGPSEHRIIKHILNRYFKDLEPEIVQIQPKIINNKQNNVGGWNEVLKYCARQEIKDIFVENEYLIIQIDTDQSQMSPFNISHTKIDEQTGNIVDKTNEELYIDVVSKLETLIKPEIFKVYKKKILFAICTHTIECWLLPIYFTNNHKTDKHNCINVLNTELRKRNIHIIPNKDKNNATSVRTYDNILKNWKKEQEIINSSLNSFGFKSFVDSLELIKK